MHSVAQYMCRRGYFPFNVDKNENISILCEDAFHFVDWMFFVHTTLHASLTLCVPDMICKRTWGGAWLVLVIDKRTRKAQDFAEINNPILKFKIVNFINSVLIDSLLPFPFISHFHPTADPQNSTIMQHIMCYTATCCIFSVLWMNFFPPLLCSVLCYNFFLCKYLTSLLSLHFSYSHSAFFPPFSFFPSRLFELNPPNWVVREKRKNSSKKAHKRFNTSFFSIFPPFTFLLSIPFRFIYSRQHDFHCRFDQSQMAICFWCDWSEHLRPRYDKEMIGTRFSSSK